VVSVILEFEPLSKLKLNKVFSDFAEYSGYELLLTNHDLIEEGKLMSHCVGTYSGKCNRGDTGIYRVLGCTLELSISLPYFADDKILCNESGNSNILRVVQLRGYGNSTPSDEIFGSVKDIVKSYNMRPIDFNDSCGLVGTDGFYGLIDTDDSLPF
jgi:hypothetical protein